MSSTRAGAASAAGVGVGNAAAAAMKEESGEADWRGPTQLLAVFIELSLATKHGPVRPPRKRSSLRTLNVAAATYYS